MPAPPPGYILDPRDPTRAIPAPSSAPSRPMFQEVKTPNPQTPEQRAQTIAATNKTNKEAANIVKPHVLTAEEVAANPTLDPGKAWGMDASGNVKVVGDVPQPFKVGDPEAINHAWSVIDSITGARGLSGKPLATGTLSATVSAIPVVGGLVGQNRANLQTKLGQISGDLRQLGIRTLYEQTGKRGVGAIARNQSEQQALQNALAPLGYVDQGGHLVTSGAQPDTATLGQGLDAAQNIYVRHLARLYGMDPDNPQSVQLLSSAIGDPKRRAMFLRQAQSVAQPQGSSTQPGDNGITASAPPPAITAVDNGAAVSTDSQASVDPTLARIAPQLEQYLAADPKKISNAMILGYVQKNGVKPSPSLLSALSYRMSEEGARWRAQGGNYAVDPSVNVPLTGARKAMAEVSGFAPGGVPVGATAAGAADTLSLGGAPDVAGIINSVTGVGPTRADVIKARDVSAAEHPYATFGGNMAGAVLSPLGRGGGALRSAGLGGLYGFLGSEDPDLKSRLGSAAIGATVGAAAHGGTSLLTKGVQSGYRGGKNLIMSPFTGDPEALATNNALSRAAADMPPQDIDAAAAKLIDLKSKGAAPPAAAALDRSGQDYLARLTAGSPSARAAADEASASFRQALPKQLADDFDAAIHDAAPPNNGQTAAFLSRPTRDIARDVQEMAGREYETGIQPISRETLKITPELADTLTHERIGGAIKDALANQKLDNDTRQVLRNLPGQLKALDASVVTPAAGMDPEKVAALQAQVRSKYAEHIPLSIDAARNIATALDRTAARLQDGSEAAVNMHQLSSEIRSAIGEQFPEYQPINARYASRMRAIEAMDEARRHFLGETPEQIDALSKAGRNFSDVEGEPEYRGVKGAEPSGPIQPSNRQFAIAGAREAAATKAGADTGESGGKVARTIAEGPNQQGRNAVVLGKEGADKLASRAAAKADVADTYERVTSGSSGDQAAKWWKVGKALIATKLTGGGAHTAAAHALAGLPGMSGEDAARVVRVYLDADSADQALKFLSKSYGARRARFIMARMASVASAASVTRATPVREPAQ